MQKVNEKQNDLYNTMVRKKSNHCIKTLMRGLNKRNILQKPMKKTWADSTNSCFHFLHRGRFALTKHTTFTVSILCDGCDVFSRCSGAILGALAVSLDRARKRTSESLKQRGTRVCIIKIYICTAIIIIARIILWGFCLKTLHTFTCRGY